MCVENIIIYCIAVAFVQNTQLHSYSSRHFARLHHKAWKMYSIWNYSKTWGWVGMVRIEGMGTVMTFVNPEAFARVCLKKFLHVCVVPAGMMWLNSFFLMNA